MVENTTVPNEVISTDLSLDEGKNIKSDDFFETAFTNATDGLLEEVEVDTPSEIVEEAKELENPGDEVTEEVAKEQETPGDDSDIKDEAPEEAAEVGEEDSIVDFTEMQQHKFEIGGKHYSANDLKAALGQISKQKDALNEVETSRKELEKEKAELKASQEQLQHQQLATAGNQQLAQIRNAYDNFVKQKDQALKENDTNKIVLLNEKINKLVGKYEEVNHKMNESLAKQAQAAAQSLDKYGFGALNTDKQRQEAFKDYAMDNIPKGLISVVNTNPELLALVEKARLYDKNNSAVSKGKLKGTKKTLPGGATKTKKKVVSKIDTAIDNVLTDFYEGL